MIFRLTFYAVSLIFLCPSKFYGTEILNRQENKEEPTTKTKDILELIRLTTVQPEGLDALLPGAIQHATTNVTGVEISIEEITRLAKEEILSDEFLEKFAPAFEDVFSPEEIKTLIGFFKSDEIKKFYKNYSTTCFPIIPSFNSVVQSIVQKKCGLSSQKDNVVSITNENFKKEVEDADIPIVLDVYSTYCSPCRTVAPIVTQLSNELLGKVKFMKVNIDEDQVIGKELNVHSMPTFIFFKNGKEVDRHVGAINKEDLIVKMKKAFHLESK